MSSTSFSNGTVIQPTWLNDVNAQTYSNAANVLMPLYGATGDGVANDATAIQAAVDFVGLAGGGEVLIPRGTFLTNSTITINYPNVTIRGEGGSYANLGGDDVSEIKGNFAVGDVILIKKPGCAVINLSITASATRQAGLATGNNHGIRFEAIDDASSPSMKRCYVDRVRATNQPASGVVLIGDCLTSTLFMVDADQNGGHGIVLNGGGYTGRTNLQRPGQTDLINCRASRNGGHGLLIGDAGETADERPYRVSVLNFESFRNGQDAAQKLQDFDWYIHGENITITNSANGGETDAGVPGHGGLYLTGKSIYVHNHRAVDNDVYCAYVADRVSFTTEDVFIHYGYINNENEASGYYDPAVFVESTCTNVHVKYHGGSADVDSVMSVSSNYFHLEERDIDRFDGTQIAGAFKSVAAVATLADDMAGYWAFTDATNGIALISSRNSAGGQAIVAFSVGDGTNYCNLMSSSGATVDVTTGTLANGSGVNGNLTIAADSATARLYISNRTGTSRNYNITILSSINKCNGSFANL